MQSLEEFEVRYKDDEIIFCEFEKGDNFYFIKAGKVKLIKLSEGQESILDVLTSGVFFGEMAMIEDSPRSATAIAVGDVILLRLRRENFDSMVMSRPELTLKLVKTFVSRIWGQQQRLKIYQYEDLSQRLSALLLNLKQDTNKGNLNIPVNVTVNDLSKWAGASVQDCKKSIMSLTHSNLIITKGNTIVINDVKALTHFVKLHEHVEFNNNSS